MPRTLIAPRGDKRYARRKKGKFTKSQDDVGRSLAADRRRKAKKVAKKGEGDRGDQKRRKVKRKKRYVLRPPSQRAARIPTAAVCSPHAAGTSRRHRPPDRRSFSGRGYIGAAGLAAR